LITQAVAAPAAAAGYAIERERGALVVALPSVIRYVQSLILEHGTLYDASAAQPGAEAFTGRGAAYRIAGVDGDWVVRHYRRGGAVAHVLRDEYLRAGEPRPLRELHASIAARARGIDTPEVVAAIAYLSGPLYRADLAPRFVPDSRDLAAATIESGDADTTAREAVWTAAGTLLRRAFAAGIEHADLNMRNILIAGSAAAPRALLLDLDRAVIRERAVSDATRARIIERLHRSRAKLEVRAQRRTSAAELAAFEAALRGFGG
jgi:3-deoxy-D-manno-octulosonic acid kinase